MSIQIQIQSIRSRSKYIEMSLFFALGFTAMVCIALGNFIIGGGVMAVYIPLSIGLQTWLKQWREARILEIYRYVCEPVFEIQYDATDRYVHARSEEHRRRLTEANNLLFKQGLITVEEIYYKDVRFKFTESVEEYEERRQFFIDDYLNKWAKSLGEKNQKLVKQWLYNQELDEVTTPIIVSEPNPDFFTTQFPMLSKILRGKEVEQA